MIPTRYLRRPQLPVAALTSRHIETLACPVGRNQIDFTDAKTPGLFLRIFLSGRRTWHFRYRIHGQFKYLKIGDYPGKGLSEARKIAAATRHVVLQGVDPAEARRNNDFGTTLGALIETYLAEHVDPQLAPLTAAEIRRVLQGPDLARLKKRPAVEVTTIDIALLLDRVERRSAPTMVNRTQAYVSGLFAWAAQRRRGGILANPVTGLKKRSPEHRRSRVLTDEEITAEWKLAGDLLPEWAALALRLILVTGQRPGEVLRMRWEHLDLEGRAWRMPTGYRKKVKGQRVAPEHDVPLSALAIELISTVGTRSGYLFRSQGRQPHKHVNALAQRVRRTLREHSDVAPWTPHDLRRTCMTGMVRMGTPRLVADKVLGHVDGSVAGIYDRHTYEPEKRVALEEWAEHLVELGCGA